LSALEVGVVTLDGSIQWLANGKVVVDQGTGGLRSVSLPATSVVAGVVVRNPGKAAVALVPPQLDTADFGVVNLRGVLQDQVQSPGWRYTTMIGPFAVFKNMSSYGWAWLTAPHTDPAKLDPPGATSGADPTAPLGSARRISTTPWGTDSYLVDATRSAEVVRSETYLRGWTATVTPVDAAGRPVGPGTNVAVDRLGILQTAAVPAGRSIVTFVYRPKLALIGLAVSTLAAFGAGLVLLGTWRRRRSRDRSPTPESALPGP